MKMFNKVIKSISIKIFLYCIIFASLFGTSINVEAQNNLDRKNGAQAATLDWIRTTALEIVSLYIARSWHGDLPDNAPHWRPTQVVDTDNQTRLDTRQRLIRWDRRSPNEILRDGFVPQVTNPEPSLSETDLYSYAKSNIKSFYVSTTKTQLARGKYVWTPRTSNAGIIYQYEIFAPGGIDVNESLGSQSPWPNQYEVAFPGGIRSEFIRSVREMRDGRVQRVWRNPRFSDPGNLQEIATRSTTPQVMWYENHPDGNNKDTRRLNTYMDMDGSNGDVVEDTFNEKSERLIADGEYTIGSSINNNIIVDLSENKNGGLVHAYNYKGLNNQQWKFSYHEDKQAYKISSSQNSNLLLTWDTNTTTRLIKGYTNDDTLDKYWRIEQTTDGYYTFKNLNDETKRLDLNGGLTSDRSTITMYPQNSSKNQKWKVIPVASYQIIPDGEYKIINAYNTAIGLDGNKDFDLASVQWDRWKDKQKWNFIYDKNKKAYKIRSRNLLLTWNSKYDYSVFGHIDENYNDQYWRLERTVYGYYVFRNIYDTTMVLEINSKISDTSNLVMQKYESGLNNQQWKIESISYQSIPDGEYTIGSSINNNIIVDLSENKNGGLVHAYNYKGLNNQQWKFSYHEDKQAYKISSSQNFNLLLTWDTNTTIGLIKGYTNDDTLDKYWRVEQTTDGYYKLRNLNDPERMLDLNGGGTSNGNPISMVFEQDWFKENPNQKWSLTRIKTENVPSGEFQISTKINYKKVIDVDETKHYITITDNMNLQTSYWNLMYDSSKKAYKIYTKRNQNQGLIYQKSNGTIGVDNIDGSNDSKFYWTIEYDSLAGGYLIRSLLDPTQVLDLQESSTTNMTPISVYGSNNGLNQRWDFIPVKK